jgi:Secretion system C-terminal sorting domain
MKRIILIIILFASVCFKQKADAQSLPCNITSTGLELWNFSKTNIVPSVLVGGYAHARLKIVNAGTASGTCTYPVGCVRVTVPFVEAGFISHYYKYDGPATFSTAKYDWTYDYGSDQLFGVNSAPIVAGLFSTEIVDVLIKGVKATPLPSSNVSDLLMQLSLFNNPTSDFTGDNTHYLRIDVAPAAVVVPITLASFDGIGDKCDAKLSWSASNEVNFKTYEVEVSKDGQDFTKVGVVNASLSNAGNYQFNPSQASGKFYYRLKMIDKNGTFSYSKIVPVVTSCNDKLVKVFPNPIKLDQLLNVQLTGYDASVKGDLYSATGQLVKSYILKSGANTLSVENLAQGFYTLRVTENGTATESIKINIFK